MFECREMFYSRNRKSKPRVLQELLFLSVVKTITRSHLATRIQFILIISPETHGGNKGTRTFQHSCAPGRLGGSLQAKTCIIFPKVFPVSKTIGTVPRSQRVTAQTPLSLHNCPIRLIQQGGSLNYAETLENPEYVCISFPICQWVKL